MLAVWLNGNTLVSINEVTLHWARLVLRWVNVSGVQLPVWENLSQYITSSPGQLNLAILLWVDTMSTSDGYGHLQGRKWRVLYNSIPCDQDCWHTDLVA